MRRVDRMEEVDAFFRAILSGVFLLAAVPKIQDPAGFAKMVNNYQLAPGSMVNLVAHFLPWLELVAGVAVILPMARSLRRAGLALIGIMLLVFIGAQLWAWAKGIDTACGCFSTTGGKSAGISGALLNLGLLALTCFSLAVGGGRDE